MKYDLHTELTEEERNIFEQLRSAVKADKACLLRVACRDTGAPRAVVCAVHEEKDGGMINLVPLAVIPHDDPHELFVPPPEAATGEQP
jgi:hypothetical protein